ILRAQQEKMRDLAGEDPWAKHPRAPRAAKPRHGPLATLRQLGSRLAWYKRRDAPPTTAHL
ncbi:MAG: hypothetical protein ACRDGS_15430, partial [Chloroflexota bacterium]